MHDEIFYGCFNSKYLVVTLIRINISQFKKIVFGQIKSHNSLRQMVNMQCLLLPVGGANVGNSSLGCNRAGMGN